MDQSVKAYLMSQGLYESTLGGYPSRDSGNNTYNVFYGIRQKIGKFEKWHYFDTRVSQLNLLGMLTQ